MAHLSSLLPPLPSPLIPVRNYHPTANYRAAHPHRPFPNPGSLHLIPFALSTHPMLRNPAPFQTLLNPASSHPLHLLDHLAHRPTTLPTTLNARSLCSHLPRPILRPSPCQHANPPPPLPVPLIPSFHRTRENRVSRTHFPRYTLIWQAPPLLPASRLHTPHCSQIALLSFISPVHSLISQIQLLATSTLVSQASCLGLPTL